VAELADALDSKSSVRKDVWVRPPPSVERVSNFRETLAPNGERRTVNAKRSVPQATAKKWQGSVSGEFRTVAISAPMNSVIQHIAHHMVGHCDCCDGYRALEYHDSELGCLCFSCIDHLMVADIELNHGGYTLCRPGTRVPSTTDCPFGFGSEMLRRP
jgi:hypothetical protein